MELNFGLLLREKFSKRENEGPAAKKGPGEDYSRERIKEATRTIKQVIKEPDELPTSEKVPAIKDLFENGIETP